MKIKELKTKMSKDLVKSTEEATVEAKQVELETALKTVKDDLAVNIAIAADKGKNLITPERKLAVDSTKIPKTFVATEAIEFLNNEDFIRKCGTVVTTEITTVTEVATTQATQKVKKQKADVKKDKIRAELAA